MHARSVLVSAALLVLAACAGPDVAAPAGPAGAPLPQVQVEVLARGLEIPWAIAFAPDGRIFLTERPGRIRIVSGDALQPEPWLTLDAAAVGEGGLLGLALDPQFPQNHFVYAAYTYRAGNGSLQNRLVRLREDPATGRGAMDRVLKDGAPGASIHDGGRVKFGPDGKLYWTLGDTTNPQSAQDTTALSGKVLRLNADGSLPADSPFPGSPVYSYGHRNPQGLAWQPGTGRLYATEHGPTARDEVNLIEAGEDYGWPLVMGSETRPGTVAPVSDSGSETWAPSGATFATRGPWSGSFLFAGLRGQALFRLILDPNNPQQALGLQRYLQGQYGRLRDVAEGPDGRLYVLTSNRDGRGSPAPDDDRLLRLTVTP